MARKKAARKKAAKLQAYEPLGPEIATSLWNGLVNYHCPRCQFATIDRPAFDSHLKAHGPIA